MTGEPERIVSGLGRELFPSISSDGRKLVYTSDRAGNDDIWLRDLELNKDTQITVGPAPEVRGVISPDGTKVVFRRDEGEQRKTNIYLTELGRGSERLLLEDVGSHMDFTPDGKKILFYTNAPFRKKTLDLETGEQHDLGLEHSQDAVGSVRFSPDQNWVSFKLQNPISPLFVARMAGGVAQGQEQWIKVADAGFGGHNWWSPDGNTVYFLSRRDEIECIWAQSLDAATKEPRGEPKAVQHLHGSLRYDHSLGGAFGYGLTADKHYLPLAEIKANIWLAEPVER